MAKFNKMVITRAGLDMIAQSQAGGTLIFTKAKLGDGQIDEQNIPDLTDLVNAKMEAQISTVTAKSEGHVEIKFIVDNQELDVGFFVREVGIFAKVNGEGVEKLYGYANAGNYTNYLSDKDTPIDSIITKLDLVIGDASNVAFTNDKSIVYVTLEDLENAITAHNADTDAHKDFVGATAEKAGVRGMVPAPAAGDEGKFLCADGTFKVAKMTMLELVNLLYPVGIIAEFTNDTDPNDIWPGTTWSKMDAGRVLVAAGTYKEDDDTYTYNLGDKGGEAKHQLTTDELAAHTHNVSSAISKHYHYQYAAISTVARTDAGINISETQSPAPVGWSSGHYESYNITGVDTPATLGKTSDATVASVSLITQGTGDNQKHENRQPYQVVSRWYRSA